MNSRLKPDEPPSSAFPSILVIDDDVELCDLLREFFAEQEIEVEFAHDGRRGLSRALSGGYDLVLLDVMIPGLDGFELLRQVRRQSQVPVIMLTARTAKLDRLAGLDAGADDYVPKPFDPDELLARARAVMRRSGRTPRSDELLEADGIKLIPTAAKSGVEASPCRRPRSSTTSSNFWPAAGRVVTRDELTAAIYRRRASPFDRAIDVHVSRLRKKWVSTAIESARSVGGLPLSRRPGG